MRKIRCLTFALLLGLGAGVGAAERPSDKPTIYDFNLPDISGKMISFAQFKGRVLLIVNVASNSSYTTQYAGLEALYEKYQAAGLVVLGFPSNDFGNEEPQSEEKIKTFAETNYHVTFPLFSKIEVRGDDVTPLFHFLTKEADAKGKGDVHWNFTKFIVDRKGKVTARFEANVPPDDPDLIVAIESALTPQTPPSPPQDDHREQHTRAGE